MRVLAASTDAQSLITQIRVAVPLQTALKGTPHQLMVESFPYVRRADLAQADVLVAQRGCAARHLRLMMAMRQRGGAVIYEIDDLLMEPAPHLLHHEALQRSRPWVLRCMAAAHVVTTSTPRLAQALSPYAGAIEVVPNYAHRVADTHNLAAGPPPPEAAHGPRTVLLAASDSLADTQLYPALRQLAQARGAALQIVGVGRAAEDAAAAGLKVQRHALMSRDRFLTMARELPGVVAVIPLDNSRFSACKSAIKWFDYAEAGIPTVTSRLPPYADVIESGRTGLLVDDTQAAWHEALCRALDDQTWRANVVRAAREQVRTHHHLEASAAAWERALHRALALRDGGGAAPGLSSWRDRVFGPIDTAIVGLRRANRSRLERRRMRRSTEGT